MKILRSVKFSSLKMHLMLLTSSIRNFPRHLCGLGRSNFFGEKTGILYTWILKTGIFLNGKSFYGKHLALFLSFFNCCLPYRASVEFPCQQNFDLWIVVSRAYRWLPTDTINTADYEIIWFFKFLMLCKVDWSSVYIFHFKTFHI